MKKNHKSKLFLLIFTLILNLLLQISLFLVKDQNIIFYQAITSIISIILAILLIRKKDDCKPAHNDFLDFETVVDSVSEALLVIDHDNKIKLFNPAAEKLTGYAKNDVLDINYQAFLKLVKSDGSNIDDEDHPIASSIKSGQKTETKDYSIKTTNDRLIPISLLIAPMGSNKTTTLITFHDISKELDEEREKMEFISTASHEMRTPIASIEGYLGLALNPKTATLDPRAQTYLTKAQASAKHLGELFRNLLSISKAEDRRLKLKPQVLNLEDLINEVIDSFREAANKKNLQLTFSRAKDDKKSIHPEICVYSDKTIVHEALSNLIDNAIKYTEKGGVNINLFLNEQNNAVISIQDTGIGIPSEDIPHLFQKFYRVDNSDTREKGGTGLGLYLTRKLIENIKGRIWVESVFKQGSTFFVSLPRVNPEKAQQLAKQEQATFYPNQ